MMKEKINNNEQKTKKPKANRILIIVSILVGVLLGILIDQVPFIARIFDMKIWELALMCLGVIGIYLFEIAIHEAGHLVFGLISVYKFISYRFLSFMIVKKDNKLKFGLLSIPGTAGQCLMSPPEMKDGKIPVFLYNIGGVVLNLVSTVTIFVMMIIWKDIPLVAGMMLFGGLSGLAMALLNGIPIKTDLVANDGYNATSLAKDPEAVRSFYTQMKMNAELATGTRLRDMPSEWFYIPNSEGMKNSLIATMAVIMHARLMDEHRFYEARELAIILLEGEGNLVGIHKGLLMSEKLFLDILFDKDPSEIINAISSPDVERFLKLQATSPSIKRINYALALLLHSDEEMANKALSEFEKAAKHYPYRQEIDGERELLAIIKEKYEEKTFKSANSEEKAEQ